jgi:membrane-associated phospholipid phosphatase
MRIEDPVDRFTAAYGVGFALLLGAVRRDPLALAAMVAGNGALGWLVVRAAPRLRAARAPLPAYVGAILPPLAFLAFYRESMVVLGSAGTVFHDTALVALEAGATSAIPTLSLPWVGEWFAFAYVAYVPLLVVASALLFATGGPGADAPAGRTLRCICHAWAACFVLYVAFPVLGPRFLDPALQAARLGPGPFSRLAVANHDLMLRGGAFPSAHVAASAVALLGLWRWRHRAFLLLLPLGASLAIGAVYLGYHYVADVVVGGALAAGVFALDGRLIYTHRGSLAPRPR